MSDDINIEVDAAVGVIEIRRGPNNFFDEASITRLGKALVEVDAADGVRCVVLCSEGRHFCAGADLRTTDQHSLRRVYRAASALFTTRKPIVAAIQGATIGGGVGLALAADFRVAGPRARFAANFARLGFHHGFALSVTLPAVVGQQAALDMLYTGRRVEADEALAMGLCDRLAEDNPREAAIAWARDIASSAPLSLLAIRSTMRRPLAAHVLAALDQEALAQTVLLTTEDFREGISASVEKREPSFHGR